MHPHQSSLMALGGLKSPPPRWCLRVLPGGGWHWCPCLPRHYHSWTIPPAGWEAPPGLRLLGVHREDIQRGPGYIPGVPVLGLVEPVGE